MARGAGTVAPRGSSARPLQRQGLELVPLHQIHPCPLQPRVNVSLDLVHKLAESIRDGRHNPVLEVEPSPVTPGQYQIVCGEQRWRAAKEAGLDCVLALIHHQLGYVERLRKQYEENHLRGDLTAREHAELIVLTKALNDISIAEKMLSEARIAFEPLDQKRFGGRDEIFEHLDSLKTLLLKHGLNAVKTSGGRTLKPLSRWSDTERALGISEVTRKERLDVLNLEPDVLAEIEGLPAQHATLIARIGDHARRAELVRHAPQLTNRQLHAVVDRLRRDPHIKVQEALTRRATAQRHDPLDFETQLETLADLCRQLARMLSNLRQRRAGREAGRIRVLIADLRREMDAFEAAQ